MISVLYWTNTLFWIGVVLHFVSGDLCFVLDQHTILDWCSATFFFVAHWNNSPRVDMLFYLHTLSWIWVKFNPSDLSPQCCMLSKDMENINSTVFGLTQSGIEHKIYHTRGDYPGLSSISKYFNVQDKCILLWYRVNLYCKEWIVVIQQFPSYKTTPTKGYPSSQVRFQMHWHNKILLNCHLYIERPLFHCRKGGLIRGGLLCH